MIDVRVLQGEMCGNIGREGDIGEIRVLQALSFPIKKRTQNGHNSMKVIFLLCIA